MTTHRRASVPPIPDLRFETAYLRKIRPFVQFEEAPDGFEAVGDEQPAREVLGIDWKNVFWVTFRDQVMIMWIQGALWCVCLSILPVSLSDFSQGHRRLLPTANIHPGWAEIQAQRGRSGVVAEELGQGAGLIHEHRQCIIIIQVVLDSIHSPTYTSKTAHTAT